MIYEKLFHLSRQKMRLIDHILAASHATKDSLAICTLLSVELTNIRFKCMYLEINPACLVLTS